MSNKSVNSPLFLGVDGGGTKCRACLTDAEGNRLGMGNSGPANANQALRQAQDNIVLAAKNALKDAGLPVSLLGELVVGLGLAGVNLPSVHGAMSEWDHPFASLHFATDLHIACLGAHGRDEGAVIIIGTGSCGYARVDGQEVMLGGHGFPLGDKASGAWMGLEVVKAVLLAHDGLGPDTALRPAVEAAVQISGVALAEKMAKGSPRDYAQFAPMIFAAADQGDELARRILIEGSEYISALARKLLEFKPGRLSILGGAAEPMRAWLDADVIAQLAEPKGTPEQGAVLLARLHSGLPEADNHST